MPIREADFTRDDVVSWHSIEQAARREGVERIALTPAQVQMLTNDLHACLASRKRVDESAFHVPPTAQWNGITCVACYGPACMFTGQGQTVAALQQALHEAEQQAIANAARAADMEMERDAARREAEQNRDLARRRGDRLEEVEQERDAMALALARKEIAK